METANSNNRKLDDWVQQCARLTEPDTVHWCDGSDAEYRMLLQRLQESGGLMALDSNAYPGCFLHRSDTRDVARVENRTFICSENAEDAGPTNHWMPPVEAKQILTRLFQGCMRGRVLYVVPYLMGPEGSPYSRVGVEITDSAYVAVSMRVMTRMGRVALDALGPNDDFVPGLHSVGELDPENRYICHFPETREIWSFGSGYGGNALLGKKCFALRIASVLARDQGWLAEHMLLLELEDPDGERMYFAGAFPSACGKTNLAMLTPPPRLAADGWTVRTIGDDIAWMHIGGDGRLWAINPEAGFFGVVPGTSERTNPNAIAAAHRDTIYTNVAVDDRGVPWWEGKTKTAPAHLTDWKGNSWTPGSADPAAHPNARFTTPALNNPVQSPRWSDPRGVPISGILFGGRRPDRVPLVTQAFDWTHGVFLGATMGSEMTAAAEGKRGVVRRDPFAMLPFCGYHLGDYFAHWLTMGTRIPNPPLLFQVNWFQKDPNGDRYLWPGFGDNLRVLLWMRARIRGEAPARHTAIGWVPPPDALPLTGLEIAPADLARLLSVNPDEWRAEADDIATHFARFGDHLPRQLTDQLATLRERLQRERLQNV